MNSVTLTIPNILALQRLDDCVSTTHKRADSLSPLRKTGNVAYKRDHDVEPSVRNQFLSAPCAGLVLGKPADGKSSHAVVSER